MAQMARMQLQASAPSVTHLTDAALNDSFYYTLFPNFHPWGAYKRPNQKRKRPEAEASGRFCVVAGARSNRLHTAGHPLVVKMHFSS
jgi:hypothetical protein